MIMIIIAIKIILKAAIVILSILQKKGCVPAFYFEAFLFA